VAQCKNSRQEEFEIKLDPKNGFPHPFYYHQKRSGKADQEFGSMMGHELKMRKNANDFDVAIWNFSLSDDEAGKSIIESISLVQTKKSYTKGRDFNLDSYEYMNPNKMRCFAFGFGYDKFEGAKSFYRRLSMNIYDVRENVFLTTGDKLRQGDSGGPLLCLNKQNQLEIVGINSRVMMQGSNGRELYNEFATTFYNNDWFSYIDKYGKPHNTKNDWHKLVLPYEYKKLGSMMQEARVCKKEKKREASRFAYKLLLNAYKTLESDYKKIKKIYRKKSEKDVFIRAHLKQLRKELNDFLLNCQFSMRGF
jgi:hypothetical protein